MGDAFVGHGRAEGGEGLCDGGGVGVKPRGKGGWVGFLWVKTSFAIPSPFFFSSFLFFLSVVRSCTFSVELIEGWFWHGQTHCYDC